MKRFLLGLAVGAVSGALAGYFAAREKSKKELKEALEKAEARYQFLRDQEKSEAAVEKDKAVKEAVVEALKNVEEEDSHILDGVDVLALSEEELKEKERWEKWKEDGLVLNEEDDRTPEEEWDDYFDSVKEYVGTARPYNITEEMYSEEVDNGYAKVKMILCVYDDEEHEDYAYDADSGKIIEGYHDLIGDDEFDTMDPCRCDCGAWYIRNDREETDFMVQYQNSALLK